MIIHCRNLQDYDLALLYIFRETKYTKRNIMARAAKAKVNDSTKSSSPILNRSRHGITSRNDDGPRSDDEGEHNSNQDYGQADSITVRIVCEGYENAVYENVPPNVKIKAVVGFWREVNEINHRAYNVKLASRGRLVDADSVQQLEQASTAIDRDGILSWLVKERIARGHNVVLHALIIPIAATIKFMERNVMSSIRFPQNHHFMTFLQQNLRWSNDRSIFMYKHTE